MRAGSADRTRMAMAPWLRLIVAPLVVALVVVAAQALRKPLLAPDADEYYYLSIARDLELHGVFTDGLFKRGPFQNGPGPLHFGDEAPEWARPGRFFAPAYPMIVYGVGKAAPAFAYAVRCHVRTASLPEQTTCPVAFGPLVFVNICLWGIALLATFAAARIVSGSEGVGWIALLLCLATGEPGLYARTYLSENIAIPSVMVFMMFAVRAVAERRVTDYAFAGIALAVAALSRPSYVYLYYVLVAGLLFSSIFRGGRNGWPGLSQMVAFTAATAVTLAPWTIRNLIEFGDAALSRGYAEVILMQRVSYNRMSLVEWLVAWIYWLPDFGDNLVAAVLPSSVFHRLDFDSADGFYLEGGIGSFRDAVLKEAGSTESVLSLLLRRYVIGDMFRHVAVTLPLTLRGLGAGQYLSVAAAVLLWPATKLLARDGRAHLLFVLLLPPVLMAGLHGFVSVNIARYNLALLTAYATIVAIVVAGAIGQWQERGPRASGGPA